MLPSHTLHARAASSATVRSVDVSRAWYAATRSPRSATGMGARKASQASGKIRLAPCCSEPPGCRLLAREEGCPGRRPETAATAVPSPPTAAPRTAAPLVPRTRSRRSRRTGHPARAPTILRACPQRRADGGAGPQPLQPARELGPGEQGFFQHPRALSGQDSAGLRAAIYLFTR